MYRLFALMLPLPPPESAEEKSPAVVTWKNDKRENYSPKLEELAPQMREAVESMRKDVPKLDSVNVNSGNRAPMSKNDPHAEGRAIDVNNINGVRVVNLATATGAEADKAREAAGNLEAWARSNPNVNQVIGPKGGWKKDENGVITPIDPNANRKLLDEHKNHYHINVFSTPRQVLNK